MRIPGFEGRRRISTDVPQMRAMPGSRVAEQLAQLGGKAAEFGSQLMQRKKQAQDTTDVSNRLMDHQRDFADFDRDIRNHLTPDGYINPEFKKNKDGSRMTYAQAVEQYWDKSTKEYADGAASRESREGYMSRIGTLRQNSILKADEISSTMSQQYAADSLAQKGEEFSRTVLTTPAIDSSSISDMRREYQASLEENYRAENLSLEMRDQMSKSFDKSTAKSFAQRLIQDKRYDEAFNFVMSGTKDTDSLINQLNESRQTDMEEFIRSVPPEQQAEAKAMFNERNPASFMPTEEGEDPALAELSQALSPSEAFSVLNKIERARATEANGAWRAFRQESQSLDAMIASGQFDPLNIDDAARLESHHNRLMEIREFADEGERAQIDQTLFKRLTKLSAIEKGNNIAKLPVEQQRERIREINAENSMQMLTDFLGEDSDVFMEQMKTGGFTADMMASEVRNQLLSQAAQQEELKRSDLAQWMEQTHMDEILAAGEGIENEVERAIAMNKRRKELTEQIVNSHGMHFTEKRLISNGAAKNFSDRLNAAQSVDQKSDIIEEFKRTWGSDWGPVALELAQQANLSDEMVPALLIQDDSARMNYLSVMGTDEAKAVMRRIETSPQYSKERSRVSRNMADFSEAMSRSGNNAMGNSRLINALENGATNYALVLSEMQGMGHASAANRAFEEIVANNFVPVTTGNHAVVVPTDKNVSPQRVEAWLERNGTVDALAQMVEMPSGFKEMAERMYGEQLHEMTRGGVLPSTVQAPIMPSNLDRLFRDELATNYFWASEADGLVLKYRDQQGIYRHVPNPQGDLHRVAWEDIHQFDQEELQNFLAGGN